MSDAPSEGINLGVANAKITIDYSSAIKSTEEFRATTSGAGEAVEELGSSVEGGAKVAGAGIRSIGEEANRSSVNLRGLMTAGRLVSQMGDRGAGQALRIVGEVAIVQRSLGQMAGLFSGVGGAVEKLGQGILTQIAANTALDESIAAATVDSFGFAAGLAAFAIPLGIAAIAIVSIKNAFADMSKAADEGLSQLERYNDIVASSKGTKELIKEAEKAKDAEDSRRVSMDNATIALDQANKAFSQFGVGANFAQIAAKAGIYGSTLNDIQKAYDSAVKKYGEAQADTTAKTLAAASPEAKLAQARLDALNATNELISGEEKAAQQKIDDNKLIQAGDTGKVKDEIKNQQEIADSQLTLAENLESSYRSLQKSGKGTTDQFDALQKAIDRARVTSTQAAGRALELSNNILPLTENMRGALDALKPLTAGFESLIKGIISLGSNVLKFGQDMSQLDDFVAQHNQQQIDQALQRGLQDQRREEDQRIADERAQADFDARMRTQDAAEKKRIQEETNKAYEVYDTDLAKYQEGRQKQLNEFNTSEEQAVIDEQDRLAQIRKSGHDQVLSDAQELNAKAVYNDQKKESEAESNEEKSFAKADSRRKEQEYQRLADEDKAAAEQRQNALNNSLAMIAQEKKDYAAQRQAEMDSETQRLQRQKEDRALQLNREEEDRKTEDIARATAYRKQYNDLITKMLGPEEAAKLRSYGNQKNALRNALQGAENQWNNFKKVFIAPIVSGAQQPAPRRTMTFQTGTAGVPNTGLFQLHAGEGVMRPDVAAQARAVLGGNYTQDMLGNALSKRNGLNIGNFSPQLIFGDVGSHSEQKIAQIAIDAMHQTIVRLAKGQSV